MEIPTGAIVPLFIVSFIVAAYEYFRINPDRRVLNLHFGLMVGAVVLMFTAIFLTEPALSPIFFALGLLWLGLALYLLRHLPRNR